MHSAPLLAQPLPQTHYPHLYKPRAAPARPLNILLVEDNLSDATLTRLALDAVDIPYRLKQLQKGTEVLPYIMRQSSNAREWALDLILLDLGLPCQDGFEILAELSNMRGAVRGIPIVILTGYEHFNYLKESYELCIQDYLTKPCSVEKLHKILTQLKRH